MGASVTTLFCEVPLPHYLADDDRDIDVYHIERPHRLLEFSEVL
jgi:hypothetical protein